MDLHAQLLGVAGLLRGAAAADESNSTAVERLEGIANAIDPRVYSPAIAVTGVQEAIAEAVERLDAIPDDIRPVTITPMREQLLEVAEESRT